jgi:aspartate 1-decarboxylase
MKTLKKPLARRACTLSALLFALGTLALPVEAIGQSLDLSGDWVLTVTSPNGTGERQVTFVQDGNTLSGEISSSRAAGKLSGTVDDDVVTFVAVVQMDSGPFEITYTATVTGDEMEGTVDFGSYGSGTFTGRRAKSSPPAP